MTRVAQAPTIERIEAPTREQFYDYVNRNTPVIMTGVSTQWPAFKEWSAERFKEVAGDSMVTVHFQEQGNFHLWYGDAKPRDVKMRFGDLIDLLLKEPPDLRYYMTEHDLSIVSPRLVQDIDAKRYVDTQPFLFLGRDTFMPLHYHGTTEAILCQIKGRKQVTLYAPDQWPYLYAHPWYTLRYYFSRVDPRKPDGRRFPKFARATPMTFTLEPGEILLIPVHWWHVTSCPGFQISATLFWKSSRERYRFPSPGLQVFAHTVYRRLALRPALALKSKLRRGVGSAPSMGG
jgi:hypothetical protein